MKYLTILFLVITLGCENKNLTKAEEFIKRNKNKDLKILLNVSIEARNERDGYYYYPYFHLFKYTDTLLIPSFENFKEAIRADTIYKKSIYKLAIHDEIDLENKITYAMEYSRRVDQLYKELHVINSVSNPKRGEFISFTVSPTCAIYYLFDESTLRTYWVEKFKKMEKFSNDWYFECSD